MRVLPLCGVLLLVVSGSLAAQVSIFVPGSDPSAGPCNSLPFGTAIGIWLEQSYVVRIPAASLDPANPSLLDVAFAPCGSGTWSAPTIQIGVGHLPASLPANLSFPVIGVTNGSFLDVTWIWDSSLQGPFGFAGTQDTWSPLGLAGLGGTGFTWNGLDDIGLHITYLNSSSSVTWDGRTHTGGGVLPDRWFANGPGAYQSPTSANSDTHGLRVRLSCVPPGSGPLTLTATTFGGGAGDLQLGLANIPGGTFEGWTFITLETSAPVGQGAIFGFTPDAFTFSLLTWFPGALPGHPVHWTWPVAQPLFPAGSLILPPGTFSSAAGQSWDFIVLTIGSAGALTPSNVVRVAW